MLITLILMIAAMAAGILIFLQRPQFGQLPAGKRQLSIENSPNYADGEFQNLLPTPTLENSKGFFAATIEYLFAKKDRLVPDRPVPVIKTDLKSLDRKQDLMIWLGHSSYFIQLGGRTILIDPVFSDYASPVSFANKAFPGTNLYSASDMPEIDYLLISHDHWDHLDYPTIMALKTKIGRVITGLGVGAHFERWGFSPETILEADWNTELIFDGLTVHALPARHFSGRSLTRNRTLWLAFALITTERRIFFSGDSGYGPHFKDIGGKFDGFNLVALDTGQYDDGWPYVHMKPEEAIRAAEDLKAMVLLPSHIGRFSIANHSWDDPFIRIKDASENKAYQLITPLIGEPVYLNGTDKDYPRWWESLQ